MTDNTQPEAMDLADWLEAVGGGPSAKRCAALLREQHARIAELEAEIAGGVQALSAALETLPHRTMVRCHRSTEKRLLKVYGSAAYAAEGVRIVAI